MGYSANYLLGALVDCWLLFRRKNRPKNTDLKHRPETPIEHSDLLIADQRPQASTQTLQYKRNRFIRLDIQLIARAR